ncbi:hypothetical protein J7384_16970, partial [Endozoicomonas sp. G2_1]|uniref:hypothetical protein n=1 Tax=Endozoicomonas sp. G2_1 TaxID=2821091 RepID=UPI001ADCC4ED
MLAMLLPLIFVRINASIHKRTSTARLQIVTQPFKIKHPTHTYKAGVTGSSPVSSTIILLLIINILDGKVFKNLAYFSVLLLL